MVLTRREAIIIQAYTGYTMVDFKTFKAAVVKRLKMAETPDEIPDHSFSMFAQIIKEAYEKDFLALCPKDIDYDKPHPKRHFYLYAKGHYLETNILEDLKKIVAEYAGLEPEHVRTGDIWILLSEEVFEILRDNRYNFLDFLDKIAPENNWQVGGRTNYSILGGRKITIAEDENYWTRMYRACLSVLRLSKVRCPEEGIFRNLGDPDPEILPLTKPPEKQ